MIGPNIAENPAKFNAILKALSVFKELNNLRDNEPKLKPSIAVESIKKAKV